MGSVNLAGDGEDSEFVFTTTGQAYCSIGSKQRRQLNAQAASVDPTGASLEEPRPLDHWQTHDLRRTQATGLQRLGVRLEVTETVLGHVSGTRGGIIGVYQRHHWAEEKREALDAWCRFVRLIAGPGGLAVASHLDRTPAERADLQRAIVTGDQRWERYLARAARPLVYATVGRPTLLSEQQRAFDPDLSFSATQPLHGTTIPA